MRPARDALRPREYGPARIGVQKIHLVTRESPSPSRDGSGLRIPLLAAPPRHPYALVIPAVPTNAASYIRGIGPMLEVISTGSHQGCL
jgi:hypothetical protein